MADDSSLERGPRAGDTIALARVVAVVIAVLGFLPIANWIPGGHDAAWLGQSMAEWASGSTICVGGGLVLAILSRRLPLWKDGLWTGVVRSVGRNPGRVGLGIAFLAFALYALIATSVFSRRPLLIDELVQVMQARIFAQGKLFLSAPPHPEFFSALHIVDLGGKWYSQFPPGGPAMLLVGVLAGAAWLVGPVCGAVAVVAFWNLTRRIETHTATALGATLVFAFAPFAAFMSGSHMNHVPTLMWAVLAMLALSRVVERQQPQPRWSLVLGFCLGALAAIRPVDAAAVALPAAAWLLARALRHRATWPDVAAAGFGVLVPVAFVLYYNARTTGNPLLFGYELLWGKSHALGFHRAPWGVAHSPARGIELVNIYFLRLQTYLFETPLPSLVPVIGALALVKRLTSFDRYLIGVGSLLVAGYFAYWHDGFYLGPRFFYLLLPFLALWTARLLSLVDERAGRGSLASRAVVFSGIIAAGIACTTNLPLRVRQYEGGLASMRLDYTGPARRADVHNALVLVRESWGTQIISRLWALGVPHSEAELLYRGVDSCLLEQGVTRLERSGVRDSSAYRELAPLLVDSARVVKSFLSLDRTERVLPGTNYPTVCSQRLADDQAGFTLLAPLHGMDWEGNVYARDLHARDSLIIAQYPDRPVYLLRRTDNGIGSPMVLSRISVDSMRAAWSR